MSRSLMLRRRWAAPAPIWVTWVVLAAFVALGAIAGSFAIWGTPDGSVSTPPGERRVERDDLASIVALNEANLPPGFAVHLTVRGVEALRASNLALEGSPGFVDAMLIEFDADNTHIGEHEDTYRSFAARYASTAEAQEAFALAVAHLEAPDGWRLTVVPRPGYEPHPPLGDESVHYRDGNEYGFPALIVYLWRQDDIVIHAVDFHPYDRPGLIGVIARDLDAKAREH